MDEHYQSYKETFSDRFYVVHNRSFIPNRTLHCHDEFEINFFCAAQDGLYYINNGRRMPVKKNSLFFFHNLDVHMLQKTYPAPGDRCTIHFMPEMVIPYCTNNTNLLHIFYLRLSSMSTDNFIVLSDENAEKYMELFNELDKYRNHSSGQAYGEDVNSVVLLVRILLLINKLYLDEHGDSYPEQRACSSEKYMLLCNMLNFIHTNFNSEINLDVLSKKFYISRSQINSIFRSITSLTPTQYVAEYRMRRAKELLIQNKSVESVCFDCGYKSPSHFSHAFKQHEGIGPKKYQTMLQAQKR